jgi:predicted ferric reductase
MISKRKITTAIIYGLPLLAIPLWALSYPETTFRHNLKPWLIYTSQVAGIMGFIFYALSLVLSTRMAWVENLLGGLDKVYQTHHTIGKIAFFLILYHPIVLAARWIPQDISKALLYLLPTHRRLAIDLGSWALLGFILLMLVTIVIKIPYDKWKLTHKLTGVIFILFIPHIFLLDGLVSVNPWLATYLGLFSILGIVSFLYKTIFFNWLAHKKEYTVQNVDRLNERVMEITLSPNEDQLQFTPGQFCFFSYSDPNISREAHPFTICSPPSKDHITIIVKALGDYTNHLYQTLKPGTKALVEGPYGRFDYKNYKQPQTWIAGGVGIAPFISWAQALNIEEVPSHFETDFYYCVDSREEAIHLQTFKDLENKLPGFTLHLNCADREGFLTADEIDNIDGREVFICGPKEMRESLLRGFKKLQIPKTKIHFEDFDFI